MSYDATATVVAAVALPLWRSGDVGLITIQREENLLQHTAATAAASRFIYSFLKKSETQIKIKKQIRKTNRHIKHIRLIKKERKKT